MNIPKTMKWKIDDIELGNISRFRGELMGIAMLFIILFHVALPRSDAFFGLRRLGNIGVDMFLFLSGVGLWFAWTRRPSVNYFFAHRFLRIYPAWLIAASLYYIPDFINGGGHSQSLLDMVGDIVINWDFWLNGELTFWYIPAIMALYAIAPMYMQLIIRHPIYRWLPVVMIMWCILVQWVTPIHDLVGHLEIFWSRVPIFLIGIDCGEKVRQQTMMDGASIGLIIIMFLMSLFSSLFLEQHLHGQFPLYVERMLYIPLTVTTILMLNRVFRRMPEWFNRGARWIGALSLEAYLLHLNFILVNIEKWHLGYWPTFFICVGITLPVAWVLHQTVHLIERKLAK